MSYIIILPCKQILHEIWQNHPLKLDSFYLSQTASPIWQIAPIYFTPSKKEFSMSNLN